MATIQSKNSRGYKYWYIVESMRVNGKPRPVFWPILGKADDLLKRLQGLTEGLRLYLIPTVLGETKIRGRVKTTYKLEEMSHEENLIMNALGIKDLHNNRLKFQGVRVYS